LQKKEGGREGGKFEREKGIEENSTRTQHHLILYHRGGKDVDILNEKQ
jgi:hypothetical protein